ncbi:transposase [Variovorax sp. dw_954]|uniref:IS66-like element accessory protein TnpA n=1 Tax=Variovorax sp. dw_954 TaxID=2720078 RepID=UPI001BD687AD|nr:transposase [Variovorax sp. dw_954]
MNDLTEREHPRQLPPGVLSVRSNGKRIYADEFKAELVRQCLVPGTSVAATGMTHGVNANLLRRWIVLHGARDRDVALTPALLPVTFQASPPASSPPPCAPSDPQSIEIEIHGALVRLHGQVEAQRLRVVLDVLARRT